MNGDIWYVFKFQPPTQWVFVHKYVIIQSVCRFSVRTFYLHKTISFFRSDIKAFCQTTLQAITQNTEGTKDSCDNITYLLRNQAPSKKKLEILLQHGIYLHNYYPKLSLNFASIFLHCGRFLLKKINIK